MTDTPSIDPARMLEEHLAQASPDLLRELLSTSDSCSLPDDGRTAGAARRRRRRARRRAPRAHPWPPTSGSVAPWVQVQR